VPIGYHGTIYFAIIYDAEYRDYKKSLEKRWNETVLPQGVAVNSVNNFAGKG
jgi:hypothetical protein